MKHSEVPARSSRNTVEQVDVQEYDEDEEYEDKLINNPRSALHYRPTETQPSKQRGNGIGAGVLILCIAGIALFLSTVQSPLFTGVVAIHIPVLWLVALCLIVLVVLSVKAHQ